ncbi:uncharacterized protein KY384_004072 [Bacidia gigantensis]|uniref:uncharacterized protein n=1 Tax=Bacidia gigantensis TaxID=2732470 RepID=UPI001D052B0C|nr:uncharacterized protein KY384_004072 [Bacidia gigantensis]KAG8530715.1 hypothetical protein KY384_004072 [Bacidia gigantensis]
MENDDPDHDHSRYPVKSNLIAEFNNPGEHQDFDGSITIPLIYCPFKKTTDAPLDADNLGTGVFVGGDKKQSCCGQGGSGIVYRVKLDPTHHKLSEDKDSYFALKEVSRPFRYELEGSKQHHKYSHPSIVTHLVSWTQIESYYIIFPLADCNLKQYMEKRDFPINSRVEQSWLLEQLCGISSALQYIHDFPVTPWHHNIKPDNILYFWAEDSPHGVFKISDWNFPFAKVLNNTWRGKVHNLSRPPAYEPPEIMLEEGVSRPYDVWSLGCVFLEVLIWAVWDFEHVKKFRDSRLAKRDGSKSVLIDDGFWQNTVRDKIILRSSVIQHIEALDRNLQKNEVKAFQKVLDVVRKMLEVQHEDRISAREILHSMNSIVQQAQIEGIDYLSKESESSLAPSIFLEASLTSYTSKTSATQPPGILEHLDRVFSDNDSLQPFYISATANPKIGPSRLENNFRRLLRRYATRLHHEAKFELQKKAARYIGRHTRDISLSVCRRFDGQDLGKAEAMRRLQLQPSEAGKNAMLDNYLRANFPPEQASIKHGGDSVSRAEADNQTSAPESHHDSTTGTESHSSGSDLGEDPSLGATPTLDGIIAFLVESKAFDLLRQELDHFVHPKAVLAGLSTSNVSSAIDGKMSVQFTPRALISPISVVDRAKAFFEKKSSTPIIWWPLRQREACCAKGFTRISWTCACGGQISYSLSEQAANTYFKAIASGTSSSINQPILPVHSSGPLDLESAAAAQSQPSRPPAGGLQQRRVPQTSSNSNANIASQAPPTTVQYVHWCVDANRYKTQLTHIPIKAQNAAFISKLKAAFNAIRGVRRWLSLTDCYGIKFVAFTRIHRSQELVACYKEDLPCPRTNEDYKYTYEDPRERFIKSLEARLLHSLHAPHECEAEDMEDIVSRIPKKVNGKLINGLDIEGYGMQAIPGWSVWRAMVALFLSQVDPLIFAVRWLCGHSGDLQNAFQLAVYLLGFLNIVVVMPDVWSLRKGEELRS